jgi:DNA-binding transcriptional ArsR family regulator
MLARRGPLPASEIGEQFPVSPPAISQHLKILRDANLVRVEKRAQQRLYHINLKTVIELEEWARQMARLWNQRFIALDQVLEQEKKALLNETPTPMNQQNSEHSIEPSKGEHNLQEE